MVEGIKSRYTALSPLMDERMRRQWAAAEARAYGWGGVRAVSQATGMSPNTIATGRAELEEREGELLTLQLTINEHRSQLNVVDEYEAYQRLMELRGWSQAQLATGLALRPAEITSVMALGKLSAAQRQLVRERQLSRSSAYAVARLPVAERDECLKQAVAGQLKRDQLNAKARRRTKTDERKSQRIAYSLREAKVTVKAAAGLNLTGLIDLLDELLRLCRKARTDGLDIQTAVRVFRDRARMQSAT